LQFIKTAKLWQFSKLLKFPSIGRFAVRENGQIIAILQIAIYENGSIIAILQIAISFRFFPPFYNLQQMPAMGTLQQNCLSAAKPAYSRHHRESP
jgi:hypothetical protein